jgi:hypothetical protein
MDPVILLDGHDLEWLSKTLTESHCDRMRMVIHDDGLKVKLDSGIWSPPLGRVEK